MVNAIVASLFKLHEKILGKVQESFQKNSRLVKEFYQDNIETELLLTTRCLIFRNNIFVIAMALRRLPNGM